MKYRTETQNIYTHIMAAPDDGTLLLEPEMLRELKIWLISDSDETAEIFTRDADTIDALRAELAAVKFDWDSAPEWAIGTIEYRDGGRYWVTNNGLQLMEIKRKKETE